MAFSCQHYLGRHSTGSPANRMALPEIWGLKGNTQFPHIHTPGWDESWPVDKIEVVWYCILFSWALSSLQFMSTALLPTPPFAAAEHRRPVGHAALPSLLFLTSCFAKHVQFMHWKTISKLPNAPGISNTKLLSTQLTRKRVYNHKLVDDYLADLWSIYIETTPRFFCK